MRCCDCGRCCWYSLLSATNSYDSVAGNAVGAVNNNTHTKKITSVKWYTDESERIISSDAIQNGKVKQTNKNQLGMMENIEKV